MPLKIFKGIFIVFCFSILVKVSEAQTDSSFFQVIARSFSCKPKIDVKIDARTSFISTRPARIFGIKAGLEFNKTVRVGLGYNWLISDINRDRTVLVNGKWTRVNSKLILRYYSPYFEYSYYRSKRLELSVPVMMGFGYSKYTSANEFYNFIPDTDKKFVVFYEPYSIGLYKPIPWVGLGFGVGYRIVLIGNQSIQENLNSPIYVLKLKILKLFRLNCACFSDKALFFFHEHSLSV